VLYVLVFGTGSGYTVTASFESASQLVKATESRWRRPVGSISRSPSPTTASPGRDGDLRFRLHPLRRHPRDDPLPVALGIANRFVDLALPTQNTTHRSLRRRHQLADTTSEVDLDSSSTP